MKSSENFIEAIRIYLDSRAESDNLFALRYAAPQVPFGVLSVYSQRSQASRRICSDQRRGVFTCHTLL